MASFAITSKNENGIVMFLQSNANLRNWLLKACWYSDSVKRLTGKQSEDKLAWHVQKAYKYFHLQALLDCSIICYAKEVLFCF